MNYRALLIVIAFLFGCQSSDDNHRDTIVAGKISKIDLAGAKSVTVAKKPPAVSSNTITVAATAGDESYKLFKVTEDGYYLEITSRDDQGNPVILTFTPSHLATVNSDYTAVYFGEQKNTLELTTSLANEVYLVKNSSGAAVLITEHGHGNPLSPPLYYKNTPIFRPAGGYIYYIAHTLPSTTRRVFRLNPQTLEIVAVTPDTLHVQFFEVDAGGNIIFRGNNVNNITVSVAKLITAANGVMTDVPNNTSFNLNFWKGTDGKLYYYHPSHNIYRADIVGDAVTYSIFIENTIHDLASADDRFLLQTATQTVIQNDALNQYVDVSDATPDVLSNSDLGLSSVGAAITDATAFYFYGNTASGHALMKLTRNSSMNTNTLLTLTNAYQIAKMVPNDAGGVIFSGVRSADGASVVGEIDLLGNDSIYATGSEAEVSTLIKLD